MISKSQEEYLKTIYIIQKQDKQPRVTDIAEKMNCTKASVNKSLKILTEQELIRREKAEKIRSMGLDPFGQRFDKTDYAGDLKEKYSSLEHDDFEKEDINATVSGRIMFIRKMGKASFFTIQDKTGSIQIYISINDVG